MLERYNFELPPTALPIVDEARERFPSFRDWVAIQLNPPTGGADLHSAGPARGNNTGDDRHPHSAACRSRRRATPILRKGDG